MVRRRRAPRRRTRTRTITRTRRVYARGRSGYRRTKRGLSSLKSYFRTGTTGDLVSGLGGGFAASYIARRVAPQFAMPATLAGGYLAGGVVGAVAALFAAGGLGQLTSMLGIAGGSSNAEAGMSL